MEKIQDLFLKGINDTFSYGLVKDKYKYYYDEEIMLKKTILKDKDKTFDYRLFKIKCWMDNLKGLTGIQIYHENRFNSEIIKTIDIQAKTFDEEQDIILEPNEYINKVSVWKDDLLNGFEIKTTKGRESIFGLCAGVKIELDEFEKGDNYLIGFGLGFEETIINMKFYYINKKPFYLYLNLGIFMLRVKLKNDDFKDKIKENLKNLNYSDKALYNICCLPDNQFFGIIKYIFN